MCVLWGSFQGPNYVALGLQAARPSRQRDCTRCCRTDPLGRQVSNNSFRLYVCPEPVLSCLVLSWRADSRFSWRENHLYTVGVSVLRRLTPSVIEALTEAQKKVRNCGISSALKNDTTCQDRLGTNKRKKTARKKHVYALYIYIYIYIPQVLRIGMSFEMDPAFSSEQEREAGQKRHFCTIYI
eukprot:COSAG06_NODE_245_length_19176_cov_167.625151_4_plen_183_part_00